MKNSNHNISSRDKGSVPPDDDLKLNINERSLSVYERYLKQIMQDSTQDPNADSSNLSRTHDSRTNHASTSLQDHQTSPKKDRPSSSVKLLLIMGVFCAALLIGVIVVILNATGVLVSLTDRLVSNPPQIVSTSSSNDSVINSTVNDNESAATHNEDTDSADIPANITVENSSSSDEAATEVMPASANVKTTIAPNNMTKVYAEKRSAGTENYKPVHTESKMMIRTQTLTLPEPKSNVEPKPGSESDHSEYDISFDDFKEEAQVVIYRETSE